jgi:hypothetical protein
MLSLTMDNASVNSVMMESITELIKEWYNVSLTQQHAQGHCLAHIINLLIQGMLHVLREAESPDCYRSEFGTVQLVRTLKIVMQVSYIFWLETISGCHLITCQLMQGQVS